MTALAPILMWAVLLLLLGIVALSAIDLISTPTYSVLAFFAYCLMAIVGGLLFDTDGYQYIAGLFVGVGLLRMAQGFHDRASLGVVTIPFPDDEGPIGVLVEYDNGDRRVYDLSAVTQDLRTNELVLHPRNDPNPVRIPLVNIHAYSIAPRDHMFLPPRLDQ